MYFSNNIYFKRVDSLQLNQITNCTLKKITVSMYNRSLVFAMVARQVKTNPF